MEKCLLDQQNFQTNLLNLIKILKRPKHSNGGAYPPDMSVLVKARSGGADYIYSVLVGYDDPPTDVTIDDGVYYNTYMTGNKIMMPNPLSEGLVEYN